MTGVYRAYVDKKFRADKLALIEQINEIVAEYEHQGYVLTVRQIYYQLVSRNFIANRGSAYDAVQGAVNDGRMAGLISWTSVEDRGRNLMGLGTFDDPSVVLQRAYRAYRRDLWENQPMRPEVWIEKQALEGVIGRICNRLRVDYYATKGYNSQSEQWRAGRRFAERMMKGQRPVVIYLGDHDPSGMDMTRDNHERLSLFAGFPVPVERIALNMDQVEEFGLPDNPDNKPKKGDSRSEAYIAEFGNQGWELDALEPSVITQLIETKVAQLRDEGLWSAALLEEVEDKRELAEVIAQFGGEVPEEEEEDEEE